MWCLSIIPALQLFSIANHPVRSFVIESMGTSSNPNIEHSSYAKTQLKMSNSSSGTENGIFLLSNQDQLSIDGPRRLILASQSPRRREILDMMGLKNKYITNPSPLDERKIQLELSKMKLSPEEYTKTLAEEKANALAEQITLYSDDQDVTFILGSDTIVDLNGKILEKPTSHENAIQMLEELSGKWHQVHTGVALYKVDHRQTGSDRITLESSYTETSRVRFSTLTRRDIEAYVSSGEPMDKAGSYGIQVCTSKKL